MKVLQTKGCRVFLNESQITPENSFGSSFNYFKTGDIQDWPCPLSDSFIQLSKLPTSKEEWQILDYSPLKIFIRIVTWNQQARSPPSTKELKKYLLPVNKFHVIAIGCQECENTMAMSVLVPSKTKWEALLKKVIGSEYDMICSHALQAMHIAIFVHKGIADIISNVHSVAVPTGIGETLGNKGGIGVSLNVGSSSFCFINAHLAAHQNTTKRRVMEFSRISIEIAKKIGNSKFELGLTNPLHKQFDFVFWFGDLNFRINGTREVVDKLLECNAHNILLNSDQLTQLMHLEHLAFDGFLEGPVYFRPTYKFNKGTDIYDSSKKQRIPSWTDRILYKTHKSVELLAYDSASGIKTSDHRPVCATFCLLVDRTEAKYDDVEKNQSSYSPNTKCESKSEVCCIS